MRRPPAEEIRDACRLPRVVSNPPDMRFIHAEFCLRYGDEVPPAYLLRHAFHITLLAAASAFRFDAVSACALSAAQSPR